MPTGDAQDVDGERERIERVYAGYRVEASDRVRWAADQPGNRCILEERDATVARLLEPLSPIGALLEVGCGTGAVPRGLDEAGAVTDSGGTPIGVDLLADRLLEARGSGDLVAQADGRTLPFGDATFDLVATFTVFSSILDPRIRQELALEIVRVLRPGGAVLWYDMRLPSANRNVTPIGRRMVGRLFDGLDCRLESITVLPPLSRAVGDRDRPLYPMLGRLPFARSHLVGILHKAGAPPTT